MQAQMLAPAAVLVLWSLVMLFWMGFTRFPAMKKLGGGLADTKPGGRGQNLEGVIPDKVNWKAHNYAHLMEQPTIFYAAALIYQATVNVVKIRFLFFILSTFALLVLAVRAVMATLLFDPGLAPS